MTSVDNLHPIQSVEGAREKGRAGGKASAESRKEKKLLREGLLFALDQPAKGKHGQTNREAIIAGLIKRAIAGDVRAFETIRDTIGEKPIEKVANVTPEREVVDGVEKALFGQLIGSNMKD